MAANFSVVRNISLLTGERVVSLVLSFFVGIAVMRYLGPENNARLMSMLAVVSLISIFAKLGLDQIVMREAARPGIDSRHVVLRFAGMRFLTSLVGSIVLILFHNLIAPQQVSLAIGFAAILILVQSSDLGLIWCRALGQFKFATTVAITVQIASSLLKLLFVSLQVGYELFLLAVLAENLVTALFLNTKAFVESAGKPRFPVHEHLTSWAEV
jgi:O-antigen/teichoic acid export membrane protein